MLASAGLASDGASRDAHANGRPPATNGVFFNRADSESIYVRSTFGLLISRDAGCSFRWVCEQAIGYGGTFDPKYAIGPNGEIYATTFTGLRVSRDGGCSFQTATADQPMGTPGRIADLWVDALDVGPTGHVWVGTAEAGKPNDIYRSTDGGATFESRGMGSPVIWWKSVAVAPSDANRVYIAGYQVADPGAKAHVYFSINGGESWTASALAGVQVAGTPLVTIAAVDAANPDHLFLVSAAANPPAGDRLYRSLDGGATFTEVLATAQPIASVVVRDATGVVAVSGEGSFTSDDGGATFGPADPAPKLGCLGKRPDGSLIGCATNWDPDFMAVGRSDDAAQWQKIFRFIELAGPVACPAGTTGHDVCDAQLWPGIRQQFGATGPTCAAATDLPVLPGEPTDPSPGGGGGSGGCCDTGSRSPIGFGLLTLLTAWVIGRRRRG